ncbi:MAG: hypothetical protein LBB38_00575 [Puniceicoccales bacterium]|jgi:hypothetical protein|nr:hypothetical protein [Puniceicoccales bacterium]
MSTGRVNGGGVDALYIAQRLGIKPKQDGDPEDAKDGTTAVDLFRSRVKSDVIAALDVNESGRASDLSIYDRARLFFHYGNKAFKILAAAIGVDESKSLNLGDVHKVKSSLVDMFGLKNGSKIYRDLAILSQVSSKVDGSASHAAAKYLSSLFKPIIGEGGKKTPAGDVIVAKLDAMASEENAGDKIAAVVDSHDHGTAALVGGICAMIGYDGLELREGTTRGDLEKASSVIRCTYEVLHSVSHIDSDITTVENDEQRAKFIKAAAGRKSIAKRFGVKRRRDNSVSGDKKFFQSLVAEIKKFLEKSTKKDAADLDSGGLTGAIDGIIGDGETKHENAATLFGVKKSRAGKINTGKASAAFGEILCSQVTAQFAEHVASGKEASSFVVDVNKLSITNKDAARIFFTLPAGLSRDNAGRQFFGDDRASGDHGWGPAIKYASAFAEILKCNHGNIVDVGNRERAEKMVMTSIATEDLSNKIGTLRNALAAKPPSTRTNKWSYADDTADIHKKGPSAEPAPPAPEAPAPPAPEAPEAPAPEAPEVPAPEAPASDAPPAEEAPAEGERNKG